MLHNTKFNHCPPKSNALDFKQNVQGDALNMFQPDCTSLVKLFETSTSSERTLAAC